MLQDPEPAKTVTKTVTPAKAATPAKVATPAKTATPAHNVAVKVTTSRGSSSRRSARKVTNHGMLIFS